MDIFNDRLSTRKRVLATVKSSGPKLVPFLATLCVYFVLWIPISNTSWFSALIKSLPVLSLGVFVLAHRPSRGHLPSYSHRILLGLLFSATGDAFLIWGDHGFFIHGMAAFGVAHLAYISAFGFWPLRPSLGLVFLAIGAGAYLVIYPCLTGSFIYTIGGYVLVLGVMAWRGTARALGAGYARWWLRLAAVGAWFFMVSDLILAVDRFCFPLAYSRSAIMSTYYVAQLFIALSVVGRSEGDLLWKRKH
uniref:lysoplasmalogenase n=1 Tax=Callorhinchus milii TaxID=7868 RepID=V9KXK4_CALMI